MIRQTIICTLLILVLVSSALCIDTSEYENVVKELSEKQAQLRSVSLTMDLDDVAKLRAEVYSLQARLSSSEMRFIPKYHLIKFALDESNYLATNIDENFPTQTSGVESEIQTLTDIEQTLADAEDKYGEGDYDSATSLLDQIGVQAVQLPGNLASTASELTSALKSSSSGTAPSSSSVAILENAKESFQTARGYYSSFSEGYPPLGDYSAAESSLNKGHASSQEAFSLVARANSEILSDDLKLALIFGPIILIIILIVYFKLHFKKIEIVSKVSKTEIPADEPAAIDRRLTVINPETETVLMTILDEIPSKLEPSEFLIEPQITPKGLLWEVELEPKKKMTLVYSLKTPGLAKGTIDIPGPSAAYEIDGRQKRLSGKSIRIKLVEKK